MAPEPQDFSTDNASAVSPSAVPLRYEIVRSLGAGGMGEVYLAKDTELPRHVAIKTIRKDLADQPEIRKRIERECRLHAQIGSHPNIVMLHDRVEHGGSICLVMEYVEGQTLQYVLEHGTEHGKPLEWSESIRIARQCLDALGRIHTHGIVHRDVKPANILLGPSDNGAYTAKLMDFGIARMTTETDGVTILTQEGTGGPGTPVYMAPEQIDSKKYGDVSPATDVYAMGIVLYQMLSGKPPFTGSLTEVFNGHLNQSPPPIALADGEAGMLDQVIGKALAKDPRYRYPNTQAFRDDLDSLEPVQILQRPVTATVPVTSHPAVEKTVVASDPHLKDSASGGTLLDGTGGTHRGRRSSSALPRVAAVAALVVLGAAGTFGAIQYVGGQTPVDEPAAENQEAANPDESVTEPGAVNAANEAAVLPPVMDDARPLPGPDFSSSTDDSSSTEFTGSALDALRERRDAAASTPPVAHEPDPAPVKPVSTPPAQTPAASAPEPKPAQSTAPSPPPATKDSATTAASGQDKPKVDTNDDPFAGFEVHRQPVKKLD